MLLFSYLFKLPEFTMIILPRGQVMEKLDRSLAIPEEKARTIRIKLNLTQKQFGEIL